MASAPPVDLMLLGTVLLWALNATVTRYVLTHGFHPLAYATIRYAAATVLFWASRGRASARSGSPRATCGSSRSRRR